MNQLPAARTARPALALLVASALVVLQLVTALHFALVPHGFGAGLSGFVHVHAAASQAAPSRLALERRLEERRLAPELVNAGASCISESCPIGFAGQHSALLGGSQASALLADVVASPRALPSHYVTPRNRVLLSAPKTSPPV
jgi:hypothetical protein